MSATVDAPLRNARAPVVFHVNGTGDRLLALPAVRALAELYPDRLRVVGPPGDGQLFYSDLPLRDFRAVRAEMKPTHASVDPRVLRVAMGDCDLLITFNTWFEPSVDAVLGELAGGETLGFFPQYKQSLPLSGSRHACDQFFDLIHFIEPSASFEQFAQPPSLPPAATALARSFRDDIPAGTRVLAVHTETAPSKEWPLESFKRVLNDFLTRHPEWLVLVVDLADRGLKSIPQGNQVVVASGMAMPPAMALVGVCDAFLGVDSCMMHAADFFQLPSIGLFGPTPVRRWGFRVTKHHRHISGAGRIEAIDEGVVAEALEELTRRPGIPSHPAALLPLLSSYTNLSVPREGEHSTGMHRYVSHGETTMKELEIDSDGRRLVNRLDAARDLMEQWDNPKSMANRLPYSLRKSDYGNINNTGGVGELPARILPPLHPQFEQFVEEGVRDLVIVVARHHGLITYTSCEGHRYGEEGPPSSERHVGVLARSQAEYEAVERTFVSVAHAVNALALTPHVHMGLLRQALLAREEKLPVLDLYLAKSQTSSWDDYFASLGPVYAATVERMKAFEPIAKQLA